MIIALIPLLFAIGGADHPSTKSIMWLSVVHCIWRGKVPSLHATREPLAPGCECYSCFPCLFFEVTPFQFWLWPNTNQLMPNIWAWNLFKQRPAEKPGRFNPAVWIVTFTEATTKLFVKCMLCCVWQHEWETARSDQRWTSHLTSKMKGKIGHYRGCIQTTKHNSAFA